MTDDRSPRLLRLATGLLGLLALGPAPLRGQCDPLTLAAETTERTPYLGDVRVEATSLEFAGGDGGPPRVLLRTMISADPEAAAAADGSVTGDGGTLPEVVGRLRVQAAGLRLRGGRRVTATLCFPFGPLRLPAATTVFQDSFVFASDQFPADLAFPAPAVYRFELQAYPVASGLPVRDLDEANNEARIRKRYLPDVTLALAGDLGGTQRQPVSLRVTASNAGLRPADHLELRWRTGTETAVEAADTLAPGDTRELRHDFASAHQAVRVGLWDTAFGYQVAALRSCVEAGPTPVGGLEFDEGSLTLPGGSSAGEGDALPPGSRDCAVDDQRRPDGVDLALDGDEVRAYLVDEEDGAYVVATTVRNRGNQAMDGEGEVDWHPDRFQVVGQDDVTITWLKRQVRALGPGDHEEVLAEVVLGAEAEGARASEAHGFLSVVAASDAFPGDNTDVPWRARFLDALPPEADAMRIHAGVGGLEFVAPEAAGQPGEVQVTVELENLGHPVRDLRWNFALGNLERLLDPETEPAPGTQAEESLERGDDPAFGTFRFALPADSWARLETEPQVLDGVVTLDGLLVSEDADGEPQAATAPTSTVALEVTVARVYPKPDLELTVLQNTRETSELEAEVPGTLVFSVQVANVGDVDLAPGTEIQVLTRFVDNIDPQDLRAPVPELAAGLPAGESTVVPVERQILCANFPDQFASNGTRLDVGLAFVGDAAAIDEQGYDNQKVETTVFAARGGIRLAQACELEAVTPPDPGTPAPDAGTDDGADADAGSDQSQETGNEDSGSVEPTCGAELVQTRPILRGPRDGVRAEVQIYSAKTCQDCAGYKEMTLPDHGQGGHSCVHEARTRAALACLMQWVRADSTGSVPSGFPAAFVGRETYDEALCDTCPGYFQDVDFQGVGYCLRNP